MRNTSAAPLGGDATTWLLAGTVRGGTRFVFPGMASVLHCGDCADGPRPATGDAITPQSGITDAGVSGLGCILYVRAMACVLLLRIFIYEVRVRGDVGRYGNVGQ